MAETNERGESSEDPGRDQLSIVARVAVDLSRSSRLEEVYDLSIQALLDVLPIDRASLLLFDQDDVMRFVASRNLSSTYCEAVEGHSPWERQATDAVPITVEDVERDPDLEPYREVFRSEGIGALAFVPLVSTSGLIGKFMLYVNQPHRFAPEDVNLAWAIATQVALTIDRSRSEQARSSLVSDLRRERNTLRFLATASELLTSTLHPDSILRTIASIAVPTVADWCIIDLLEEQGSLRRVAVAHKDVEKVRWAQEIQEKYPSSSDSERNAVARVVSTGVAELYETVSDGMLLQMAQDEEHLNILRELGMTSAMIVPLTARGHKIGGVTFVSCDPDRNFNREDLSLATDLAQRAALAVDNARLYEREHLARQEAEDNARRIARLQEVTAALSEANTPDRVADVIIELGIRAFEAKSGAVAMRSGNHAELIRTIGYALPYIDQFQLLPLDEPDQLVPMTRAIISGEPVLIPSEDQLLKEFPNLRGRTTGEHEAFVAVPLALEGRTFGSIGLGFRETRTFSDQDREFLLALGRHCAQALDRARLYEAERNAREEAERANRAKDDFLATLSHEMRTPLTSALGWARMLERGELDSATQHHAVSAIYRSTRSQVRIVEDLLDVSRIIAGKMTIRREPLDLRNVVEDATDLLSSAGDARGVTIETNLRSLIVSGDVERLRQIFWNLLSNAIKFSGEDSVVRVNMRRHEDEAEVEVVDTGRGIDPQFIPHLFERFRQADSSTTRSFGGLGLGLSIVHHLVQLHGGSVEGSSEGSGRGAVFVVRLPMITGEIIEGSEPRSPGTRDFEGVQILVVEDELDSRTMIEMILRRAGASVRSAAAPSEARRMLAQSPAHLIVSDIAMPDEDGPSFVRSLRESGDRTPVLALSAYGRGGDEQDIESAGFDDFLRKPVDPEVFLATLERLLKGKDSA